MIFWSNEILINLVKNSSYTNMALCSLLKKILCTIIKLHLSALFTFLFYTKYEFINFITVIIINIILCLLSDIIYEFISKYNCLFSKIVDYCIHNYNEDNYIIWKRYITLIVCTYLIIILSVSEVTNYYLIVNILQNACTILVYEILFERKIIYKYINMRYKHFKYNKKAITKKLNQVNIDINYYQENNENFIEDKTDLKQINENKNLFIDYNYFKDE